MHNQVRNVCKRESLRLVMSTVPFATLMVSSEALVLTELDFLISNPFFFPILSLLIESDDDVDLHL